jgi:hypothetical protein
MPDTKLSAPRVKDASEYRETVFYISKLPIDHTHSLKLDKNQLLNYQTAFEHSATAHPEEWQSCCQWAVARAEQQPQPQALAQTAPRV